VPPERRDQLPGWADGHRRPGPEHVSLQKGQETIDVALRAARGEEEGDGEVIDGAGRHEDRPEAIMDLVDAKEPGEMLQHSPAILLSAHHILENNQRLDCLRGNLRPPPMWTYY
jgi:hypothetical protein